VPRAGGSTLLERAFAALAAALDGAGVPFMMIGGVAVIAHGVKRLTTDVDAVVPGGAVDLGTLTRRLARAGIAPRVAHVERFARANLVLLMRHEATGVDLDISLGFTRFELEALAARVPVRFGRVKAPMARPEAAHERNARGRRSCDPRRGLRTRESLAAPGERLKGRRSR
jgi:hypothetical protein